MTDIFLPNDQKIEVEQGVVFVGANGSGKTRLGSWIETDSPSKKNVHRITAQKSLDMPDDCSPIDTERALKQLFWGNPDAADEQELVYKLSRKFQNRPNTFPVNDYKELFTYIFSEHNKEASDYLIESKKTDKKVDTPDTLLDRIIATWEEIIPHRKLIINGTNILVTNPTINEKYKSSEMSDGERVLFYLIGRCLCVPPKSIIVIDEPELHLHKTIQYALWNKIEKLKKDCVFIYLTHDVEFAASRVEFKKIWLKSYNGSNNWEWQDIGNEIDLPEELLLEVYGNRKKVLFIEGDNGSYDVKFFRNMFSDFFVKPVESCENVINYTKALRKNTNFHQLEVFGLVDRDRRTNEEVESLQKNGIYTLKVAEIENIFAVPKILKIVCEKLNADYSVILENIKKVVFKKLNNELDVQISERAVEEIKFLIKGLDIKSKSKVELETNFANRLKGINVSEIYEGIEKKFKTIIKDSNYDELLSFYNRKTIASCIGGELGLKKDELPAWVVRISNSDDKKLVNEIKNVVKDYIDNDLSKLITIEQ